MVCSGQAFHWVMCAERGRGGVSPEYQEEPSGAMGSRLEQGDWS